VSPVAALAQSTPPPLPGPGQGRPDLNQGDPPERVGRIAAVTGTVSFHNSGDTQWSAATPNYPVSSGNAFWTEPSSQSELEISASRIAMAGGTEFDVATLDASGLQGVAAQGEIYIDLQDLLPNEVWSIQTPRGLVRLSGAGRYDIVVGTTDQPTLVTVLEGSAQIDGAGASLQVAANLTATITGTDSFQGSVGTAPRDAFLTERLNAERPAQAVPAPAQAVPAQAQVVAMPGGRDLAAFGSWSPAPEYGQVWYPPVAATWAPYREGHWAYVAPWGWTWVDDAPWGFAPFHYGRWIQISGRWAWTPGAVAIAGPPVYAPALVTFIGIGAGIAVGAALATGSIGWVPLGPGEPFRPWYHASNTYIRQVNIAHVTNVTNNITINNYVNRGAATSIPAAAMIGSRPVQAVARPVTAQELAAARPIAGQQPIRPSAETAGVTPVVARQLNLPLAAGAMHPVPGPAVRPVAAGATGFARPALAPSQRTQVPGVVEPSHPASAAPGAVEPSHPAPVAPGARPAGEPAPEPGHPAAVPPTAPRPEQPGAVSPEVGRPAGIPVPQPGHPAAIPPAAPRPEQPGAVRPERARPAGEPTPQLGGPAVLAPAAPRPETQARPETPARPDTSSAPPPRPEARPTPPPHPEAQPAAPPRSEARPTPPPRPEAQPAAPPRPEAQPAAPPRPEAQPAAPPRPEARPAAPPRPEAQPAAPPRPEARPATPTHPEPQQRKKEPDQH